MLFFSNAKKEVQGASGLCACRHYYSVFPSASLLVWIIHENISSTSAGVEDDTFFKWKVYFVMKKILFVAERVNKQSGYGLAQVKECVPVQLFQ